jgi:short-subunit dehydrogenase
MNITSEAAIFPMTYWQVYCATKSFGHMFSLAMSREYKDSVDVCSVRPSEVSTNMTNNKPNDVLTITSEECA